MTNEQEPGTEALQEPGTEALNQPEVEAYQDPGTEAIQELGRAHTIEAGRGWVPVREGFDRARDAASRASSLEPDLAEGYSLLGRIQITYDMDVPAAEVSHRRALDLAPGSSVVLDGASVMAYKLGRLDEALGLGRRALGQDPLSPAFWHNLGLTAHAAGRLAESETAFRRAIELVPQRFVSGALLALVLISALQVDLKYILPIVFVFYRNFVYHLQIWGFY